MEQLEELFTDLWATINLYLHHLDARIRLLLADEHGHPWDKPLGQSWAFVLSCAAVGSILFILLYVSLGDKPKTRKGTPTVLLVGPSDGGKTSLFINLVQGEHPQTHTSIQVSDTTFSLSSSDGSSKQVRLVDVPGHPRLRDEVKKHVAEARGVVFVVDIVALVRNAASVAEQLPPLLTLLASTVSQRPAQDPIQLLLLAHKVDLLRPSGSAPSALPSIPESSRTTATDRLKTILTREMDRLKSARGNQSGKIEGMSSVPSTSTSFWSRIFGGGSVQGESGDGEDTDSLVWGGKGPFRWEDVDGVEVSWGCTALGGVRTKDWAVSEKESERGDGLDDLRDFIWEL